MVKISVIDSISDSSISAADEMILNDSAGPDTKTVTLSQLTTYLFNNIPANVLPGIFDHVVSGGVWSADAAGSTRAASMTEIVVYINNRRITVSPVSGRLFTASRDTYIDILDNLDGTGTLVYTEVTNNNTSPALASNSIRIGIIITGASSIANAGSINQGQEDKVLPIASSVAYTTTDSLGNLICSRDPNRKKLGYRQLVSSPAAQANNTQVPGLTCPVKLPTLRSIWIETFSEYVVGSAVNNRYGLQLWDGTVGSGTQLSANGPTAHANNAFVTGYAKSQTTPTSTTKTYNTGLASASGNGQVVASTNAPAYIKVGLD